MKKIYLTLIFISVFFISVFSQCYPDQDDSYWNIGNPYNSFRVSACNPNYNCHGFIVSYFEDQCQPSPFTYITPTYSCPESAGVMDAIEWQGSSGSTSCKYVQVCSESNADIAYYDGPNITGGHSAVKVGVYSGVFRYISKYGADGPLVSHNLNESWYHCHNNINRVTSTTFWTFIDSITGNTNIIGTNLVTFNVLNKPGVTYSWSIPNGSSNISIYSGQNQNSVTLTPVHSGTAVLQLNLSSSCGSVKTQQVNLNIQTNVCLEGTYSNSGTVRHLYTVNSVSVGSVNATVTCPNATSLIWQKTSGNISSWYASGANVSFTMPSGGSISFSVTAKNGSTTIATRSVTFYNYGSFMVFPNPITDELKIDLNKELSFNILLQRLDGQEKKEIKEYSGGKSIDVSGLKPGNYSIIIYFDGKPISKQQIIISKQ